jgi:broad specificity phosphatase PhoE
MQHLYYVRHGQSTINLRGKLNGSADAALTEKGREQAELAGREAGALNIDYIVSSPLIRALDTAKIIANEINYPLDAIKITNLAAERDYGNMEGQPWSPNMNFDSNPDVETKESVIERARKIIKIVESSGKNNILIVSHGAVGRALRHLTMPDKPFDYPEGFINGKIVKFI